MHSHISLLIYEWKMSCSCFWTASCLLFYVGTLTVCWINCSLSVPGLSKCTRDWQYCQLLVLFLQILFPIKRGIVFEERKNICARPIFFCKFSFYLNFFWLLYCLKHSVIKELEQATFLSYKQTETRSKFSHARTVVFPRCSNIFSVSASEKILNNISVLVWKQVKIGKELRLPSAAQKCCMFKLPNVTLWVDSWSSCFFPRWLWFSSHSYQPLQPNQAHRNFYWQVSKYIENSFIIIIGK